jgi:dihydroorotate dehydrogenase
MFYEQVKKFLFNFDPEIIHEFTLDTLSQFGSLIPSNKVNFDSSLEIKLHGLKFPNRVGLAAGMDKSVKCPIAWQNMGFGFVEYGTVTFHPQEGNPKPRLFRLPEQESILNRLGFNNPGAKLFAKKLKNLKDNLQYKLPIGVNIGKSRIIEAVNQAEVINDYLKCLAEVLPYSDYITVNVSSPNTPGLREWQSEKNIKQLLNPIREACNKPLFVKISPDMDESDLLSILSIAVENKLEGIIATNTTIARDNAPDWTNHEAGGISGKLLTHKARKFTEIIGRNKPSNFTLISVGGIDCPKEARLRLDLGADLVQIYTGLIFRGPAFISEINQELKF